MRRILFSERRRVLGLDRFHPAGELLDAALGGVELRRADGIELLSPLPERDRLVEARVAALEPLDDRLQLALGLLETELGQRVSSTVAPKPPVASSTSTRAPEATSVLVRTMAPSARTIA
jgi:hypothetical protein